MHNFRPPGLQQSQPPSALGGAGGPIELVGWDIADLARFGDAQEGL